MGKSRIKKLTVFVASASAFLLLAGAAGAAAETQSVHVSSTEAEVCSAPCADGLVVARPQKGTRLKVLERWYKVELPDGTKGWVQGDSVTSAYMEEWVTKVIEEIKALVDSYVRQERELSLKFVRLLDGEIDTDKNFLPQRIKLPKAKYNFLRIPTVEEKVEFVRKSVFASLFAEEFDKLDSTKREIGEKQKAVTPYLREPITVGNEDMTVEILPYNKAPAGGK